MDRVSEKLLYKIMGVLNEAKLPIVFKGALILFKAKSDPSMFRRTNDVDCDWVGDVLSSQELEKILNDAIKEKLPNISFSLYREHEIGRTSAGFDILVYGKPFTTFDMSIRPETSSTLYSDDNYNFYGYDLNNIISDKISVLSSKKIARRIKDLIDIYSICIGDTIIKADVITQLEKKNRKLEDFDFFINNKVDVEHAYNKYKTIENKPEFNLVYDKVYGFIQGFLNNDNNIIWDYNEQKWIKKENI